MKRGNLAGPRGLRETCARGKAIANSKAWRKGAMTRTRSNFRIGYGLTQVLMPVHLFSLSFQDHVLMSPYWISGPLRGTAAVRLVIKGGRPPALDATASSSAAGLKRSKELPTLCTKQNRKGQAKQSRLSILRMCRPPKRTIHQFCLRQGWI